MAPRWRSVAFPVTTPHWTTRATGAGTGASLRATEHELRDHGARDGLFSDEYARAPLDTR